MISVDGVGTNGAWKVAETGEIAWLCMPKGGVHVRIDAPDTAPAAPAFAGLVDEFLRAHQDAVPGLQRQMKNKVRRCPCCSKAVAHTLLSCNLCGASLAAVAVSLVDNVFTGFLYGIERCASFPLTISIREQTRDFLVFDDLLALSPCHLNVIPTAQYIPDWTYLLRRPREGLALITAMFDRCAAVLRAQFLAVPAFREGILRGGAALSDAELVACVAAGFNIPPSQYQLHLQFIMMPHLPYQWLMYLKGNHYTHGRFFPFEYVRAVLALDEPYEVTEDTKVESVIAHYRTKGVDYDVIHAECYRRTGESHAKLANWRASDFEACSVGDRVHSLKDGSVLPEDAKAAAAADKLALQNYGRPYTAAGKPNGTFYRFPKTPNEVHSW
jgi:hypothetical protein